MKNLEKMTDKNRERYIIAKCKRYLNNPIPERLDEIMRGVFYAFNNSYYCGQCMHEDIGYCGLRTSTIDDYAMRVKFCIPSLIKYYEAKEKK